MGEDVSRAVQLDERELSCWLRGRYRAGPGLGSSLSGRKSIARAERVLNKIKTFGELADVLAALNEVDMSLYVEELAAVMVAILDQNAPSYAWYILICAEIIQLYGQDFYQAIISHVTRKIDSKAEFKDPESAPIKWDHRHQMVKVLVTLHLGNVVDAQKEIKALLSKLLERSNHIHSFVSCRKRNLPFADHMTMPQQWEEFQTLYLVTHLLKVYGADLVEMTDSQTLRNEPQIASDDQVVDLTGVGLFSSAFRKNLHQVLKKHVKQRCIISLLIVYELQKELTALLQVSRLSKLGGDVDIENRLRWLGISIGKIVDAVLYLLKTFGGVSALSATDLEPNTLIIAAGNLYIKQDHVVIKHGASGAVLIKHGTGVVKEEDAISDAASVWESPQVDIANFIPRIFQEEFPSIFPRLHFVFEEFRRNQSVGVTHLMSTTMSGGGEAGEIVDETPVDVLVKWKDATERDFYDNIPNLRASLPSIHSGSNIAGDEAPEDEHDARDLAEKAADEDEDDFGGAADGSSDNGDDQSPKTTPALTERANDAFGCYISDFLKYVSGVGYIDSSTAHCVDEFARVYFLRLFDTKNHRRRLAKTFMTFTDQNSYPLLLRFASIIDKSSDVGSVSIIKILVANIKAQLSSVLPGLGSSGKAAKVSRSGGGRAVGKGSTALSVSHLLVFYGELCKFRAVPVGDILNILTVINSQRGNAAPSNFGLGWNNLIYSILETCGRFIAGTYGADIRLMNLLSTLNNASKDLYLEDQVQILNAACLRMRGQVTPLWDRIINKKVKQNPQIMYLRYLICEASLSATNKAARPRNARKEPVDLTLPIAARKSKGSPEANSPGTPTEKTITVQEILRRIATLDFTATTVLDGIQEALLDLASFSPGNDSAVMQFLSEFNAAYPRLMSPTIDELLNRILYDGPMRGKQHRLTEICVLARFVNYKIVDVTLILDVAYYLLGLNSIPFNSGHFRTLFDAVHHVHTTGQQGATADSVAELPFDTVYQLLKQPPKRRPEMVYNREIPLEFESWVLEEQSYPINNALAELLATKAMNHYMPKLSAGEEQFRYKLVTLLLRHCGQAIAARMYRARLNLTMDVLTYCISFYVQEKKKLPLLLQMDFDDTCTALNYAPRDLWNLPKACNDFCHSLRAICDEIETHESDFRPLLIMGKVSLLSGFKQSWQQKYEQSSGEDVGEVLGHYSEHDASSRSSSVVEDEDADGAERRLPSEPVSGDELEDDSAALFDKELAMIVNESLDIAKSTAPRNPNSSFSDIQGLSAKVTPNNNSGNGPIQFRLVTRNRSRGGKSVFKVLNAPPGTAIAAALSRNPSDTEVIDKVMDRSALKRFVLERAMSDDMVESQAHHNRFGGVYRPPEPSPLTKQLLFGGHQTTPRSVPHRKLNKKKSLNKSYKRSVAPFEDDDD